jgi:hypothetical protein
MGMSGKALHGMRGLLWTTWLTMTTLYGIICTASMNEYLHVGRT